MTKSKPMIANCKLKGKAVYGVGMDETHKPKNVEEDNSETKLLLKMVMIALI